MNLPPGSPVETVRATMMAEFLCGVTGTTADLDKAMAIFERLVETFMRRCEKVGVTVHFPQGTFRPMNREEAVAFVPRKFHWAPEGERVCNTEFVSRKQLTDERNKVTCKLCLRWMEKNDERVEAGGGEAKGREERPRA